MKPALNIDLKEKFFALYHKQVVVMDAEWEQLELPPYMCYPELARTKKSGAEPYLLLRDIRSLTDDEAIEVAKIIDPEPINEEMAHTARYGRWYLQCALNGNMRQSFVVSSQVTDYLRSIGIAIGFMGYSVEELVEAGFVKLVTEEK